MKKSAKDLKKGDKIKIAEKIFTINEIEVSEPGSGKSGLKGKRKVRIEATDDQGGKIIIIRPEDYPFEIIE